LSSFNDFIEKLGKVGLFWKFEFTDENDYNSINLVRASKYEIADGLNKDV